MKRLLVMVVLLVPMFARAETLDLNGYQRSDGAITTLYGGDTVDVYFASKALLTASDGGLDIKTPGDAWVRWAIAQQGADGRFGRYRYSPSGWMRYDQADADDAALALWVQLLHRLSPGRMPVAWWESARRAEAALDALFDPEDGLYHISPTLPVGLLMDNVEIEAALRDIAAHLRHEGKSKQAAHYQQRAEILHYRLIEQFRQADGSYRITTQTHSGDAFYPDKAAQLFPMLYALPGTKSQPQYQAWMQANGREWLRQRQTDFAWGLIAIAALVMDDPSTASCWRQAAEPMRYSRYWNVVEEAVLQRVKLFLKTKNDPSIPCVGKDLL